MFTPNKDINPEYLTDLTSPNPSSLIEQNSFNNQGTDNANIKRIFQVFHKKEIIIHKQNLSKKISIKNSRYIIYKCIYCGNKFNKINRFESHMKIHVSLNKYNFFIIIDWRKTV